MKGLLFLAFFISFVVFLMSASMYFYYYYPISEFTYSSTAFVTKDLAGFDLNSSSITFGSIALGGSSTRNILINNSYPFSVRVKPYVEGDISKIINYSYLEVEPYQSSKFQLTISADSIDQLGNYTGNISIKLFRV